VIRVANLREAIQVTNQTGFGLTSGLESLDDREQAVWKEGIRAGNLYINRSTTGAIVLRQPFGGMGKSAFGPGIKAGGPNYVAQLMDYEETAPPRGDATAAERLLGDFRAGLAAWLDHETDALDPEQVRRVITAIDSYALAMTSEFGQQHDHFLLLGEDNIRRYLPVPALRVRLHSADGLFDLFARVSAARVAGCRITVSRPRGFNTDALQLLKSLVGSWGDGIQFVEESDQELAALLRDGYVERIRYAAPGRVPILVREAARPTGAFLADAPVLAEGRIELLWVFREQSVASRYHRYGNLLDRADEKRAPVL
jgi:RHH-type proline utilization regulon transcriptional repressor/proline dehydrogenase/delta 1-pyrroline-5-carboxylate dehydrogenase